MSASRTGSVRAVPATPPAAPEAAIPMHHVQAGAAAGLGTPADVTVMLADEVDATWRAQLEPLVPPAVQDLWKALIVGPVSLRALELGLLSLPDGADGGAADTSESAPTREVPIAEAFLLLDRLWAHQALVLASAPDDFAIQIRAGTTFTSIELGVQPLAGRPWRASRFAALRAELGPDGQPIVTIENPATTVLTRVAQDHAPRVAAFFAEYFSPRMPVLAPDDRGRAGGSDAALLFLFAAAGVVAPADAQGALAEDRDTTLRQWEHHDLLMHFRSRQGRHPHDMGAGFRFKGTIEPQPVLKDNPWRANAVVLAKPDLQALALSDMPLTAAMEMRRSIRAHDDWRPISLTQIGHFLWRTARVRSRYDTQIGEFTSRPYPSGGASHELELYLSVDRCADLARGFYYYDPVLHALCAVSSPNADMEALLLDAWTSSARMCRPQVLITLASRFQRVGWKYSGMAYAAQLKNVGVLYQTFYLVATAMNLAGCALGLGNAARFSRLAGTHYFRESSVGEFMLGSPAA